ncbi:hypothetical protein EAS64_10650 [Trebonia kvetii]|uniref:Uncharacterized protein n=1 Tax=Trebonia kvetii TaxID=2480626 RepID=A0A6P2C1P2_9ACTN|nr:hypothetical protein [Trebonia kvetii]TVZ05070.1 hypothetical protein EAS64_10650 [Trebonia kvetii]
MKTWLGCLGGVLLLLAAPGLIIAGLALMAHPQCAGHVLTGCPGDGGTSGAGVALLVLGILDVAVLVALAAANGHRLD